MQQLALALPSDVTFTTFTAHAGGGAATSATAATPSTTARRVRDRAVMFTLQGCASSQAEVATVLTSL